MRSVAYKQSPVGEVVSPLIEEETDVPRSNQPPTNYLGVVLIYLAAAALVRPRPHSSPTFNASEGFVGLTDRIFKLLEIQHSSAK